MKPVPIPGNPWGHCAQCGAPFLPKNEDHLYCCGKCRQQAYRDRHRKTYTCPGCGQVLHVADAAGVTKRQRYCSRACNQRVYRWRKDGRFLRCQNNQCPRYGFNHTHSYDKESNSWVCHGCGQLQPGW